MHNPHKQDMSKDQISYLNINKQITAVVAGRLSSSSTNDVLFIGTRSNLQCYDVDQNRDLFFKDLSDGVSVVLVGQFGSINVPLAIVGGNCSLQVGYVWGVGYA